MAFDAFLSLIPLAAFIGWAMFRLHTRSDLLAPIVGPIAKAAPKAVVDLVGPEFLRLSDAKAAALAPLSLLVFMWVLSGGLSTAMYVFEAIFGSAESSWYQRRVVALIYVIGAAL